MKSEPFVRFRFIAVSLSLIAALLVAQLVRIQVSANTRALREDTRKTIEDGKRVLYPERGNIYDRWGHLLAGNKEMYQLGIDLRYVVSPVTIASTLASVAGMDYNDVYTKASTKYDANSAVYIDLRATITPEQAQKLQTLQTSLEQKAGKVQKGQEYPSLLGLVWTPILQRSYPEGSLASNLVGAYTFLDRDGNRDLGQGIYGVEAYYNDILAGQPVIVDYSLDPNKAQTLPDVPPGASLILTIDIQIQAMVEKVLDDSVAKTKSDSGTIVVLDPKTGEILAMASTPRMDPNKYWDYSKTFHDGTETDRAVSQMYEPGSVFKVLTMATGLDTGTVTPDTVYLDRGTIEVGGITITNWDFLAHGPQTMEGCMELSLNVCLAWVATQIGEKNFYSYLDKFGIGRMTNVDLSGEVDWPVLLPGQPGWTPFSLGANAYGQGINVTPIQLASAISAVANHGELMAPHILKAIVANGRQEARPLRSLGNPISDKTATVLTNMLAQSVESESYQNAHIDGYRIAGKTGTASISVGKLGYITNLTNASFVGWGPVDDPQFLVYVWLEKPRTNMWGSLVASPVFAEVVRQLVVLMNIPPDDVRAKLKGQ
ncbi:MAG: penicillin-binding protein 2 [Anaerolineaceae bacterium]